MIAADRTRPVNSFAGPQVKRGSRAERIGSHDERWKQGRVGTRGIMKYKRGAGRSEW